MSEKDSHLEEDEVRWAAYMRAAQQGDGQAFEKLLTEILPRLRSLVRGRLSGREYAEDVVQNVMLSIHRSRHTYHPNRPFKPWLNAVARNAVIDAMRARRNDWRHQDFENFEIPDDTTPALAPPKSLSPELANALSQLPETQREAVELIHLKELSLREAARASGTSVGAMKVRAHRGRARLREILGRE
jgi:RNA polymerase sigma-70 factor (ECF subfamily)